MPPQQHAYPSMARFEPELVDPPCAGGEGAGTQQLQRQQQLQQQARQQKLQQQSTDFCVCRDDETQPRRQPQQSEDCCDRSDGPVQRPRTIPARPTMSLSC